LAGCFVLIAANGFITNANRWAQEAR